LPRNHFLRNHRAIRGRGNIDSGSFNVEFAKENAWPFHEALAIEERAGVPVPHPGRRTDWVRGRVMPGVIGASFNHIRPVMLAGNNLLPWPGTRKLKSARNRDFVLLPSSGALFSARGSGRGLPLASLSRSASQNVAPARQKKGVRANSLANQF